ncbi:MAG: Nif3-like dinuclear metal center hexameric protein, partial [Bacteroidota bacterium]
MRVRDIQEIMEAWAPREIAWEDDNVGLQIGNSDKKVQRVLVALEISFELLAEAKRKKVDLIITHHPLLFQPLKSITESTNSGRFVRQIIQSEIAVYSAHTNLDFTRGGVSFVLAERLGLTGVDFLHRTSGGMKKVSVFVPPDHVEAVAEQMASAGAGVIGNYEKCSYR